MAVLFLREADVLKLLDMPAAVEAVEEAFRRLAAEEAVDVPRQRAIAPGVVLHSMSAAAPYLGLVGWKAYVTTRAAATFHVGVYEHESGALVALIEADHLGRLRTGATTGVAAEWMADAEASELGLFGAGRQAATQLAGIAAVRPIRRAFVYSRNAEKREQFAERMSRELSIEVVPVDRPQEAAGELPIVVTATSSREPVFDGTWLDEGALVCAIGSNWQHRAEIDAAVIRRADHIVCDSVEACQHEAGDFVDALEKGIFDWSRAVNLADVVAGRAVGRNQRKGITLFKSVGLAIEDVALAHVLIQRAREQGVGQELPI